MKRLQCNAQSNKNPVNKRPRRRKARANHVMDGFRHCYQERIRYQKLRAQLDKLAFLVPGGTSLQKEKMANTLRRITLYIRFLDYRCCKFEGTDISKFTEYEKNLFTSSLPKKGVGAWKPKVTSLHLVRIKPETSVDVNTTQQDSNLPDASVNNSRDTQGEPPHQEQVLPSTSSVNSTLNVSGYESTPTKNEIEKPSDCPLSSKNSGTRADVCSDDILILSYKQCNLYLHDYIRAFNGSLDVNVLDCAQGKKMALKQSMQGNDSKWNGETKAATSGANTTGGATSLHYEIDTPLSAMSVGFIRSNKKEQLNCKKKLLYEACKDKHTLSSPVTTTCCLEVQSSSYSIPTLDPLFSNSQYTRPSSHPGTPENKVCDTVDHNETFGNENKVDKKHCLKTCAPGSFVAKFSSAFTDTEPKRTELTSPHNLRKTHGSQKCNNVNSCTGCKTFSSFSKKHKACGKENKLSKNANSRKKFITSPLVQTNHLDRNPIPVCNI